MGWIWQPWQTPDMRRVEECLNEEMSFGDIATATKLDSWSLQLALSHLESQGAITNRIDESTGRHVRLYRAST